MTFDVNATKPDKQVPPEGDPTISKIAFIAEAPASTEVILGRPLVGPTGRLFDNLIAGCGLLRSSCYIDNVFPFEVSKRLKPSEEFYIKNELVWSARKGFTAAGQVYVDALLETLRSSSANVIVPMGNPALEAIFHEKGIAKWRGSLLWSESLQKKVLPTLHPASCFRDYQNRYLLRHDIIKAVKEMQSPDLVYTPQDLIIQPDFQAAKDYLTDILKKKPSVSFDIEAPGGQLTHLSLSIDTTVCMSIQFRINNQHVFDPEQELQLLELFAEIFGDQEISKWGQNLTYDMGFLLSRYGIFTNNFEDTMLLVKLVNPGFPMNLGHIASLYTDIPYYKDEGKKFFTTGIKDEIQFAEYNAKDSLVVHRAMPALMADCKRLNNIDIYQMHKRLIPVLMYMGHKGFLVDQEELEKEKLRVQAECDALQERLNSQVGFELNVRSATDLKHFFVEQKKVRNLKPSYNEESLIRLNVGTQSRKPIPEAGLIIDIRKLRNLLSKDLNLNLKDGRLTSMYRAITSMGRVSSTKDETGHGTNLQNRQGFVINRMLRADPGCLLYSCDLSQADNRSVAYMAPEPSMIDAFESGTDVHSHTASLMYGVDYHEVIRQNDEKSPAPIGNGDRTYRQWGKESNHAYNFGLGAKKAAERQNIPLHIAKQNIDLYHQVYPKVRGGYQKQVRDQLNVNRTLVNCYGRHWLYLGSLSDLTEAFAFPAQSNTADNINIRGLIPVYYNETEVDSSKVELLRQVHDSIDFQIPLDAGIDYHIAFLQALNNSLMTPLEWKGLKFSIPVNFKVGWRLDPMEELDMKGNLKQQLEEYWK